MANRKPSQCVSSESLIDLYYQNHADFGECVLADDTTVPDVYRQLLQHTNHMTVTVESHHGDSVDVEVLRSQIVGDEYRREILLRTHRSQQVVQYGIVRLWTKYLSEVPRREILREQIPLGRVLINHNVLREIELFALHRVTCGPALAKFFSVPVGTVTYGRTALIYCDHDPAIELLEIVSPESE